MTAQIGNQVITLHIFPNILRSKGNQTTKFGQLIDYSMRKGFFFQKTIHRIWWRNSSQSLFCKIKIE